MIIIIIIEETAKITNRFLVWNPFPQVTLQGEYSDHGDQVFVAGVKGGVE